MPTTARGARSSSRQSKPESRSPTPAGDGHLSVVTPVSPIGKAVLGRRTGEVIDVTVDGDVREWQITYVG